MPTPPESTWPALEWANQRELLACLGRSPRAERGTTPDWVVTGVPSNECNGVLQTRLHPNETAAAIAKTLARFEARRVPFQWHVRPDDQPSDLAARLLAHGCRKLAPGVGMALDLAKVKAGEGIVPGLRIQRVVTPADLAAWMDVWVQYTAVNGPCAKRCTSAWG